VIRVTLVLSPGPREVHEESLSLPDASTVLQALRASALLGRLGLVAPTPQAQSFGVWGCKVDGSHVLRDGDRLELYRPLQVDPKVARRARFEAQGARAAGLFARHRAGAKAGY
jgi:putative ubiquitin-RnfH superfamily antitoxin RatB of RatAB toxin-antitoxin module